MRIGIIGAGNVGSTLGKGWAARGHEIVFGVRDPRAVNACGLGTDIAFKLLRR